MLTGIEHVPDTSCINVSQPLKRKKERKKIFHIIKPRKWASGPNTYFTFQAQTVGLWIFMSPFPALFLAFDFLIPYRSIANAKRASNQTVRTKNRFKFWDSNNPTDQLLKFRSQIDPSSIA